MHTKHITALALAFGALGAVLPTAVSAQAPSAAPATPGAAAAPLGVRGGHGGRRVERVNGLVTAVSNGTFTVTPMRDPAPVTFTLSTNARVIKTTPGTLSDVQSGDAVRVDGTLSTDGTSMAATRVTLLPTPPPGGRNGGGLSNGKRIAGMVSSISPLKVTTGDGSVVAVTTTASTHVTKVVLGASTDLVVGSHIETGLTGPDGAKVARQVMILPARLGRKRTL